jgi:signal transduction histidine kinase
LLRNPLAPISAAAELLRMGKVDERRVQQSSTIIARQVRHMTRLVDDLLDVSRVTRGLITPGQRGSRASLAEPKKASPDALI